MKHFTLLLLIFVMVSFGLQAKVIIRDTINYSGTSTVTLTELDFNGNPVAQGQFTFNTTLVIDAPASYGGLTESNDFNLFISTGENSTSLGGYLINSANVVTAPSGNFMLQSWLYEETDPNLYIGQLTQDNFEVNLITGEYEIPYSGSIPLPMTMGIGTQIAVSFTNATTIDFALKGLTKNQRYFFEISGQVTTSTTTIEELRLLSPEGTLSDTLGHPTYVWTDQGVDTYQIYLAGEDIYNRLAWQNVPSASFCNGTTCSVDLTNAEQTAWLANGRYQVWLYAADWVGPFWFDVSAPAPGAVTFGSSGLSWSAERASWFQIYLAPTDDLYNPVSYTWLSRTEACGSSTTCTLSTSSLPTGRQYSLFVQGWGPGGLTDWAGPLIYTP